MPRVDPVKLRQQLGLHEKCSRRDILEALNEKAAASQKPAIRKKIMERHEDLISLSTVDRIDRGHAVSAETVYLLASTLEVHDRELLATNADPRDWREQLFDVIRMWAREGGKATDCGFPWHPELYYRVTGDWKGWNNFLDVPESHEAYAENSVQDELEEDAFALVTLTRQILMEEYADDRDDEPDND